MTKKQHTLQTIPDSGSKVLLNHAQINKDNYDDLDSLIGVGIADKQSFNKAMLDLESSDSQI